MRKNKYYEFARNLHDVMREAYPSFSWYEYASDYGSFEKRFDEVLFKALNGSRSYFSRKDLDLIAENFEKIASDEGSGLLFPKNIYECVEYEEKYLERDEIICLAGFLALVLKRSKTELNNVTKSCDKQKMVCLSFDTDPEKAGLINDGKSAALIRGINKKYNLRDFSITLPYENKVKEFFDNKELQEERIAVLIINPIRLTVVVFLNETRHLIFVYFLFISKYCHWFSVIIHGAKIQIKMEIKKN